MYEIIKNVIAAGGYKLAEIRRKIKKLYIWGDLTEDQADELLALAVAGASADAERPEIMEMLRSLAARVGAIEAAQNPGEGSTTEIEAWKPWDGLSDKYQLGAVVTHNGAVWESTHPGQNTWEPGTPGTESLWKKRVEV